MEKSRPKSSMRLRKSAGSMAVARSSVFFVGRPHEVGRVTRFLMRSRGVMRYQPPASSFARYCSAMRVPPTCFRNSKYAGPYSMVWPSASITGCFSLRRISAEAVAFLSSIADMQGFLGTAQEIEDGGSEELRRGVD